MRMSIVRPMRGIARQFAHTVTRTNRMKVGIATIARCRGNGNVLGVRAGNDQYSVPSDIHVDCAPLGVSARQRRTIHDTVGRYHCLRRGAGGRFVVAAVPPRVVPLNIDPRHRRYLAGIVLLARNAPGPMHQVRSFGGAEGSRNAVGCPGGGECCEESVQGCTKTSLQIVRRCTGRKQGGPLGTTERHRYSRFGRFWRRQITDGIARSQMAYVAGSPRKALRSPIGSETPAKRSNCALSVGEYL